MDRIKAIARTQIEQVLDLVLKNINRENPGQLFDEMLLILHAQHERYKTFEDLIFLKNGLLFRKNYRGTASVKYYQDFKQKQPVDQVLRKL